MDAPPSSPPSAPTTRSRWRAVAVAGTCTAAMLVNSSNNTSVAIALPTIGGALHARAAALQWLVSAYPLSSGCLLLFCGHLADVHGRKRVFTGGSLILFAFTLACGFAQDEVTLAVLRGLQGVGGAATIPAALGILAHEFPPSSGRARAAAFSSFSAGAPVGGALGMVLGGLVTQLSRYTWRAQFFLSAAIALATLLVGIFVIPPDAPLRSHTPSLNSALTASASPNAASASLSPNANAAEDRPTAAAHTYPPSKESSPSHPSLQNGAPPRARDTRTDWPGAILSAAGLVLLVFVLGQGSGPGVPPPRASDDTDMGYPAGTGWREYATRGKGEGRLGGRGVPQVEWEFDGAGGAASGEGVEVGGEVDVDFGFESPVWEGHVHAHDIHEHHHHRHRHHHPPPPPRGGFLSWLFGRPPPPHPHPHHHHDRPHPRLHHDPPHRRSPPTPIHAADPSQVEKDRESPFWRVQSENGFAPDLDVELDLEFEVEADEFDNHPHRHRHPSHDGHGPHEHSHYDGQGRGAHTHDHHPHHHHHHHDHEREGPHAHEYYGPHPHHHGPHHGPHHHGPPPPPPGPLGALMDWLSGRPPRPPHWHGPRNDFPPGGPGGPPGGGMVGYPPPPPPMHGGQAWGMAYIVSLLVLSLLLLVLFGLWELRLERVHSRPGGALYVAPPRHAHGQEGSDDTADADDLDTDHTRRSSASSGSRPLPGPSGAAKSSPPASKSRSTSRLASNRFVRAALAYTPSPLLPPSLFARRRGRLGVIYLIALFQFAAFMIWAFWVQLYYQVYIGYSPVRTVVRLVPMFVTGLVCNVLVALLVGRVRTVWLLAGGTLTTMVAPLLFALVVPAAPYWAYGFPAAVCSVVGVDFLFAAGTMFVADSVAPGEMSVAGGVFQTMTQLGTSFGVTASTIVFNHVQQIAYRTQANALGSYHAAMWMGVGFGGLATLFALLAFYGVGMPGRPEPPPGGVEKHSGPQA